MALGDKQGDKNAARKRAAKERVIDPLIARSEGMKFEALWAFGLPLPEGFKTPPDWVRNAIRMSSFFRNLAPILDAVNSPNAKDAGTLFGAGMTALSIIENVPDDAEFPGIADLRNQVLESIESDSDALRLPEVSPSKESPADLVGFFTGLAVGGSIAKKHDENDPALSEELVYLFWLNWREIERLENRSKLAAWVQGQGFFSCSFKLLEKVCQRIELKLAPVGAPSGNSDKP